nr:MAG TPA: hypothetical protein [Bacteriophage sp.]
MVAQNLLAAKLIQNGNDTSLSVRNGRDWWSSKEP